MIGEMRERITLEMLVRIADEAGGATRSWTPVATVWARATPLSSGVDGGAERQRLRRRYEFRLRYRDDVDHETRVTFKGRAFDIVSLQTVAERNRLLVLTCEETRL